eukprot:scpid74520/ scgid15783/ Omega-amidase NIT2; Nitrilase homolog 2
MAGAGRKGLKLALIQLAVGSDKAVNIRRACEFISQAAKAGAQLVALPECFNSPYGTQYFQQYAEPVPDGDSSVALATAAKQHNIYIHGGSVPERDGDKLYNTSVFYGPDGSILGKYRKMHLFDIDIPGKIQFKESETLSPGNGVTIIETPWCKVGLGICYDLRFFELAALMARKGVDLLLYPGAFNMTTGPKHWELLQRGRAVDNQCFVACASPARDETATYVAWGHSTVVDPWGAVLAKTDEKEGIVYADLDFNAVDNVRASIPTRQQKRHDVYKLEDA